MKKYLLPILVLCCFIFPGVTGFLPAVQPADGAPQPWLTSEDDSNIMAAGNHQNINSGKLSKPPSEIVLGYEGDPNSMSELHKQDLQKACEELKIQCVYGESISQLVDQNVDAIISFSNRWHVLGAFPEIRSAAENGIPVIVLDAESSVQGAYNLSIESAATRGGLKWMLERMGGKGEFVYFNVGTSNFHQAIIDEVLKDYPDITATSMPADYEGNRISEEKISDLVTLKPNLGAIWANEFLQDVFWGIHNSKIEPIPSMICVPRKDAWQFWKKWIDEGTGMQCYSTVKPGGTAYEGVYVAYYLLTGEEIDPSALGGDFQNTFVYDFPVITNDNLDEWLEKTDQFRIGDGDTLELPPMTPEEIKEKWFFD